MPRESRHVWVGNLPEKITDEEVAEYFSRFGRVEKIKLLPKISPDGGRAAFVDFVDIRSATKANEAQNTIGGRELRTNYNEPGHKHNQKQDFHGIHGGYQPPGGNYRQPPVVIYAAPPPGHVIPYRQHEFQKDDRPRTQGGYHSRRGRSPGSRGSLSDGDRSPSPRTRSRGGGGGYSSGSDISDSGRCTVSVRNISYRGSDSSLEESLYHEFKKYGDIINIIIKGSSNDKYAYVQFSKPDEAEDATRSSGKLFLGEEIKVAVKSSSRAQRSYSRGLEDLQFDPHATRTIFVGNVDRTIMPGELKDIFARYGEIVDIDIKKMQTGITTYAFIQFLDINGATLSKRKMDRQQIGNHQIKVGYGRGTPSNALWVGNLPAKTSENEVIKSLTQFGRVQRCLLDKKVWQALVRFETIESCTKAFAEMHGKNFNGKRLGVDYASPLCRNAFYSRMERHGYLDRRHLEPSPTPPDAHVNFQNAARGGPFQPRGNNFRDDKDDRNDRHRDRSRGSPTSRTSNSPKRRSRDSHSPVLSTRSESRSKRKLSSGRSPNRDEEPSKKKEKKKKKKEKNKKKTKDGEIGEEGLSKSKVELKKEKKEKKKAEKAKKKAEKKEKKLKILRDLEEERLSIEAQVNEETTKPSDPKESDDVVTEDDGISDISQVTEENILSEAPTSSAEINEKEKTKDEDRTDKPADDQEEEGQIADEQPALQSDGKQSEKSKEITTGTVPTDEKPPKQNDDSSDSSSSSSTSSDSDDSDDSSDNDRTSKKASKPKQSNDKSDHERTREPKAYRQESESDRRERNREYSRSKYPDHYRSSSGKDNHRTKSPSYRGRSRSRSPYRRDASFDRRRGRSPVKLSPRYNRSDSRSEKRQKTPLPPPPSKDSKKEASIHLVSNSTGSSQSTDTLMNLLRRFPVMWQGLLGLKNDTAAVQMHYISGNVKLAEQSLPRSAQPNEVPPPLRISQRMKLEPSQLEGVDKRIQDLKEHCMLLALPCGRDPLDVHAQTRALKTGFITYLQQKQAAGIINIPNPSKQPMYVVHIFPPCEFAQSHLVRVAPDLLDSAVDSGHLMVLVTPI